MNKGKNKYNLQVLVSFQNLSCPPYSCPQDPGLTFCLPVHNYLHQVPKLNIQPISFCPIIHCLIKFSKTLFSIYCPIMALNFPT